MYKCVEKSGKIGEYGGNCQGCVWVASMNVSGRGSDIPLWFLARCISSASACGNHIQEKQIGMAYDHYEAICSGKPKTRQIMREFKNTFSWKDLRVHFIGVWDTVSSVELVREDVFLSTSSFMAHACHFCHTLPLNELQVKFMLEYFHEMNSRMGDGKSKYIVTSLSGEHTATPMSKWQESTVSGDSSSFSGEGKHQQNNSPSVQSCESCPD
ncbi:hypothetical protein HD554DRAFT_2041678 [Boletus coccyginus]|nr:hypothetical protein HD554DRAFT_2041678 [Boletus coccyginus]